MKVSSIALQMQQRGSFAILSSYKIFRTAVDNIIALQSSCEVPNIFVWLGGGVDKERDRKEGYASHWTRHKYQQMHNNNLM
jgi:hypothetical protein